MLAAFERAGLRPVKVVFWNSLFTTFVEHVLMKLGEAALGRQKPAGKGQQSDSAPAHVAEGVAREIRARRRVRKQLRPGSPVYLASWPSPC